MKVSIVTPEKEMWSGDADLVIARSPEGEFGIMRGHIPFLAALVPGRVTLAARATRESFLVPGGFLEASGTSEDYHVIVLADDAEPAGEIDPAEAQRRAEELSRRKAEEEDEDVAEARVRAAVAGVDLS